MGFNKCSGQGEGNEVVLFKLLNSTGTPTITEVFPDIAAADISVVDTGDGDYAITIKNFKGPRGLVNIQASPLTISTMASPGAVTYTGDNVAFSIKVENDASTATDSSIYVRAEAF